MVQILPNKPRTPPTPQKNEDHGRQWQPVRQPDLRQKSRAPREAINQHLAPGLLMLEQSVPVTLEPWRELF